VIKDRVLKREFDIGEERNSDWRKLLSVLEYLYLHHKSLAESSKGEIAKQCI
jgi:hypothetical protein